MRTLSEQLPRKIEHLVDTDLNPETGECSFYYNYLRYTFEHPEGDVIARSYLDNASEVSIHQCPVDDNIEDKLAGILYYLRLRYQSVTRLGPSGYIAV